MLRRFQSHFKPESTLDSNIPDPPAPTSSDHTHSHSTLLAAAALRPGASRRLHFWQTSRPTRSCTNVVASRHTARSAKRLGGSAPPALTERQVLRCAGLRQCYDPAPVGGVMAGCGYTIFDTAVGRCGIAWGDGGIIGVQLPEVREIETRRRLFRLYPDARELPPPLSVETAIEGIAALLRGEGTDLSGVTLDINGIQT